LQNSKEVLEEVIHKIESSNNSMKKTLATRENYRPLAKYASKLFFIINDFASLNIMYQFSLDSYINLFSKSIEKKMDKGSSSSMSDTQIGKLRDIGEYHRYEIFKFACRSFFEKDKLLLALQIAVQMPKLVEQENEKEMQMKEREKDKDKDKEVNKEFIDLDEYNFFLYGGSSIGEKKNQYAKPSDDWITTYAWDCISDLDLKMPNFNGLVMSFIHNPKEWKRWYMSAEPEGNDKLPLEWEQRCTPLSRMILLKAMRPDR
jgi:dynein heavy chain